MPRRWTDEDGEMAISIDADPDTGDVTIASEVLPFGSCDFTTIPAAAIPWLRRALEGVQ